MADMPIAYCKAKCCGHCRQYRKRRLRGATCVLTGKGITDTYHCTRFRWQAGCRPPKPEKPATVGGEVDRG